MTPLAKFLIVIVFSTLVELSFAQVNPEVWSVSSFAETNLNPQIKRFSISYVEYSFEYPPPTGYYQPQRWYNKTVVVDSLFASNNTGFFALISDPWSLPAPKGFWDCDVLPDTTIFQTNLMTLVSPIDYYYSGIATYNGVFYFRSNTNPSAMTVQITNKKKNSAGECEFYLSYVPPSWGTSFRPMLGIDDGKLTITASTPLKLKWNGHNFYAVNEKKWIDIIDKRNVKVFGLADKPSGAFFMLGRRMHENLAMNCFQSPTSSHYFSNITITWNPLSQSRAGEEESISLKRFTDQLFKVIDPNAPQPTPIVSSAGKKLFKFLKYFGYFARIFF